jgi:hypothetical protein
MPGNPKKKVSFEQVRNAARTALDAKLSATRLGLRSTTAAEDSFAVSEIGNLPIPALWLIYYQMPIMLDCILPAPVEFKARTLPEEERCSYICGYFKWRNYALKRQRRPCGAGVSPQAKGRGMTSRLGQKTKIREADREGKIKDVLFPDPMVKCYPPNNDSPMLSSDQPVWWEQIMGD